MAILPTHHSRSFHPIPGHRSGLRLRGKYVLRLIFVAFLLLCFGAFFFVPDLRDRIEKLVNSSKVDDTGAKGITGGEPSDEITKERRNFVKKVG